MKKIAVSGSILLGACCPKASVKPAAHAGPAWTTSTVDLAPAAVHAQLGAPVSGSADGNLGVEECFAVTPPFSKRCVRYIDGLVLHDNAESHVPASALVKTFDRLVTEATATFGAPDSRINFAFTPGEHVLGMWEGRGFRFGESCVLESARKAAEAATPEGLESDAPELQAAATAGTACVHAGWEKGISIGNRAVDGDVAMDGMYLLNINYRSQDEVRRATYKDALNAGVKKLMKDIDKLGEDVEALDKEDATPEDRATPEDAPTP